MLRMLSRLCISLECTLELPSVNLKLHPIYRHKLLPVPSVSAAVVCKFALDPEKLIRWYERRAVRC